MDQHIKQFFQQTSDNAPRGNYHSVIPLHLSPKMSWEEIEQKVPKLCHGWYELAHVSTQDRIDFTHDYWLSKLPYTPALEEYVDRFFKSLDDVGIFLTQKKYEDPFDAHLIYSIQNDGGFFTGALPATERELSDLQHAFPDYILPNDYMLFLQIHNGFTKTTDSTGIIPSGDVPKHFDALKKFQLEPIPTSKGTLIDPATLVPFYESFGMPFYQCFLSDWYPEQEMGNVYYSGETRTVSDFHKGPLGPETMAFTSFVDWLDFYLERIF